MGFMVKTGSKGSWAGVSAVAAYVVFKEALIFMHVVVSKSFDSRCL